MGELVTRLAKDKEKLLRAIRNAEIRCVTIIVPIAYR